MNNSSSAPLILRTLCGDEDDFLRVRGLYERAFPPIERVPARWLLPAHPGHFLGAFYMGNVFCGFAAWVTDGAVAHISYFAMEEGVRGHGLGTRALSLLAEHLPGARLVVDIEAVTDDCDNPDERRRRRDFYLREGYAGCNAFYRWKGERYELLSRGGIVTEDEFWAFWEKLIGKRWDDA